MKIWIKLHLIKDPGCILNLSSQLNRIHFIHLILSHPNIISLEFITFHFITECPIKHGESSDDFEIVFIKKLLSKTYFQKIEFKVYSAKVYFIKGWNKKIKKHRYYELFLIWSYCFSNSYSPASSMETSFYTWSCIIYFYHSLNTKKY